MTLRAVGALLACAASGCGMAACGDSAGGGTASVKDVSQAAASSDRALVRAPDPPRGPFQALVTSGGLTTRAFVGSACLRSSRGASCVDALPPGSSAPVLPVKARSLVGIGLGAPARSVTARLVRLSGGGQATPLSGSLAGSRLGRSSTQWTVHLPAPLPEGAATLRYQVRYTAYRGDAVHFDVNVAH
jgi:hypothetical protein